MHIHTHIHTRRNVLIHTHVHNTQIHLHIHTNSYIHDMHTPIHTCTHMHTHTHTHSYSHMHKHNVFTKYQSILMMLNVTYQRLHFFIIWEKVMKLITFTYKLFNAFSVKIDTDVPGNLSDLRTSICCITNMIMSYFSHLVSHHVEYVMIYVFKYVCVCPDKMSMKCDHSWNLNRVCLFWLFMQHT